MSIEALRRVTVDFTRFGHGTTVSTRLFPEERAQIEVGTHVIVQGDDVEPREAVVTSVHPDGRTVDLQLLDPAVV